MNPLFFIWFGDYLDGDFDLMQYVTIKSAVVNGKASQVVLYTEYTPVGPRFEELSPYIVLDATVDDRKVQEFRKSDVMRFDLLYRNGGTYSDMDMLFLDPIDELFSPDCAVIGLLDQSKAGIKPTERAFVSSPPKNEFCAQAKEFYASQPDNRRRDPNFVFEVGNEPPDVHLLDPDVIYPFQKMPGFLDNLHKVRRFPDVTRAIHLWRHAWPRDVEKNMKKSAQANTLFGKTIKDVLEAKL